MSKVIAHSRGKKVPTRKHNHFPNGKTGHIPQGVGIINLNLLKR